MSPKWIEARQEAQKVVPLFKTVGGAPFEVGPYKTHVDTRQSLTYENEPAGNGNTTKIIINEGRFPGENHLSQLVVYTGGRIHSFDVDAIRDKSANEYNRTKIESWFEWAGSEYFKHRVGDLSLLRVDLLDGTFINFIPGEPRIVKGKSDLVQNFPEKLNKRTVARLEKLIGMEIPLKIDYEARAEELLTLSELRPFALAFLARGQNF